MVFIAASSSTRVVGCPGLLRIPRFDLVSVCFMSFCLFHVLCMITMLGLVSH